MDFTLIFGRLGLMEYICMWIFKVGKFEYIDIWQVLSKKNWQVVKNIYDCWKYMYMDLYVLKIWLLAGCGSIYVENMIVARCKDSIENMTIGIFVEFEKKKMIVGKKW